MYIKCIILSLSLYLSMIASLSLSFWLVGGPTWLGRQVSAFDEMCPCPSGVVRKK